MISHFNLTGGVLERVYIYEIATLHTLIIQGHETLQRTEYVVENL